MTNEFNWGFTHNSILIDEAGNVLKRGTSGINLPLLYPGSVQEDYVPAITFNGTRISASPGLGAYDAPFINYNTTIDTSDNLTKVWGSHTIKGGIYLQRSRKDQTSFANFTKVANFGDNASNPYDTGFGFSNALLGVYNTFTQATTISTDNTATGISRGSSRIHGRFLRGLPSTMVCAPPGISLSTMRLSRLPLLFPVFGARRMPLASISRPSTRPPAQERLTIQWPRHTCLPSM